MKSIIITGDLPPKIFPKGNGFKDLSGTVAGKLKVLYPCERKKDHLYYLCQCQCGNYLKVARGNLTRSHSQSCGCLRKEGKNGTDTTKVVGLKFNRLTIIKRLPNNNHNQIMVECQCDCGNKIVTALSHLRSNHTQSCGCYQKEQAGQANFIDLKGKIFGKITVLEDDGARTQNNTIKWKCKCECGSEVYITSSHLISGHSTSCGCIKSKGEEKIALLLSKNNILYKKEYTFDDLIGEGARKLRFDFGILDENNILQYLIEFDGIQHFEKTGLHRTEEHFLKSIERDKLKNQYCLENKILLIRIPYTKLDLLTIDDLQPNNYNS